MRKKLISKNHLTPAPLPSLKNQQKSRNDFGKVWEWGKIWNIVKSTIEVFNDFHCRKVKNGVKTWILTFYLFLIEILRCSIYYSSLSSMFSVLNIFSNSSNVLRFGSICLLYLMYMTTLVVWSHSYCCTLRTTTTVVPLYCFIALSIWLIIYIYVISFLVWMSWLYFSSYKTRFVWIIADLYIIVTSFGHMLLCIL